MTTTASTALGRFLKIAAKKATAEHDQQCRNERRELRPPTRLFGGGGLGEAGVDGEALKQAGADVAAPRATNSWLASMV